MGDAVSCMYCEVCDLYYVEVFTSRCVFCNKDTTTKQVEEDTSCFYRLDFATGFILLSKQPKPLCPTLDTLAGENVELLRSQIVKLRKWGTIWKKIAFFYKMLYDSNHKIKSYCESTDN